MPSKEASRAEREREKDTRDKEKSAAAAAAKFTKELSDVTFLKAYRWEAFEKCM
jgi:hypothetical protein